MSPRESHEPNVPREPRLLAAALAGLLCLTACGGEESDPSSTGEITSSKEMNLDAAGFKAVVEKAEAARAGRS